MFSSHLFLCQFCEPSPIVSSLFLTSLISAPPLFPTSLIHPRRFLSPRRHLFLPLLLPSHLLNLKSNLHDLRWINIISLNYTSPSNGTLNLLLSLLSPRDSNNAQNPPPAKDYSSSLLHSTPWLAPLVLLPLSPKSRKSRFRISIQRSNPNKPGTNPRGSQLRT
jgi:hypothetical protein